MKFGLLMPFWNPPRWEMERGAFYAALLDQIERVEELGFDNIWLTEHHFDDDGWSPALLPLAAGIATRTQRIRIGTFVLLTPFGHALRIAEDATTVDILSKGRLDLGLGQGYRNKEFDGFGFPREKRGSRFEEDLEVIHGLWNEDAYSFDGEYYHLKEARLTPKPIQHPHPPMWIGARGKRAVQRAARLGLHFMGTGEFSQQGIYDEELERCGRNPADFAVAQLRWVYIAESREQAWDEVAEHMHYLFSSAFPLLKQAGDLKADRAMAGIPSVEDLRKVDPTIPGGAPIVGTAEDCVEALQRYREATRITHLAMGMHMPGLALDKVMGSIERFARDVMPRFSS